MQERRRVIRRKMDYYFKIYDANAQRLVGHLSDISARGMLLDSLKPIEVGKTIQLKIEITSDALDANFIDFVGRAMWCRVDSITPNVYNVGFEIVNISPKDAEIFRQFVKVYGS